MMGFNPVKSKSWSFGLGNSFEDVASCSRAPVLESGSVVKGGSVVVGKDCVQKIMYVKRRRNQLVAALGAGGTNVRCGGRMENLSVSGYYKKRKYQLVRTSLVEKNEKIVDAEKGSRHGEEKRLKMSVKGKCKSLNSSIWRLNDTKSNKPDTALDRSRRVKQLFPWKRTTYLRGCVSTPSSSSVSILSQKLLLRSRPTGYIRSTDGFSLRRSKVLSVGGSNLKWSKPVKNKLKKANEESTPAVVAEKNRKERRMVASTALSRSNHVSRKWVYKIKLHPGERIYRIGLHQYKMDPTRKTLHRITNDEDHLHSVPQADKKGKKAYVPRRLFFGNDEYVRIGNGNQLVRDPKKRTRTLASDKVRWSLHTARSRLAKEKKFCQFFTRFGHCNKDDGKCRYIHDPSKIAVCTKFLNDSCTNPSCKLTHKVIPERMPDCSYFLQGLCSSKSCPYRHVNVHPSASACEGFLKGYCASGNECRQKHTYVCPSFEATEECPQGSKCKLHHPIKKNQTKKPVRGQKKARGRYFISSHTKTSDYTTNMLSERCNSDIVCEDGRIADYMSLDVSYGEVECTVGFLNEQASDPSPVELQVSSTLEDIIKPIRLMNRYPEFSHRISTSIN